MLGILLWFAVIAASTSKGLCTLRIVNGTQVSIEVHPYIVSVQLSGKHICGGSVLSANVVLTAAHCFQQESDAGKYTIQFGVTDVGGTENIIPVSSFRKHPQFNSLSKDYDVGLIYLAKAIKSYSSIALASHIPGIGTAALVLGWGANENGELQKSLNAAVVHTIGYSECSQKYMPIRITVRMVCAGEPSGGKDACMGDSGGPLVVNNKQVGIVSFGTGCGRKEFPGVYTSIAHLRGWIQINMKRKPK